MLAKHQKHSHIQPNIPVRFILCDCSGFARAIQFRIRPVSLNLIDGSAQFGWFGRIYISIRHATSNLPISPISSSLKHNFHTNTTANSRYRMYTLHYSNILSPSILIHMLNVFFRAYFVVVLFLFPQNVMNK